MLTPDQFVEEVKECQAALRAFVRSLGVDPMWVDDVAQEALVIAFERRDSFDETLSFRNWVWGIAKNCVLNDRRKTARRSRILHENVTDILTSTAGKIEVEEGKTDSEEELVEALKNCLDEMPEKSRMLLQRRYEENARAVDLASALDMNAATVRKNLERIRTSLRKCVELRVSPQGSA
ncbi:MAG: sigma-70 family RNA polymerase sigma factor [Verrucomicrobiota bacterium]